LVEKWEGKFENTAEEKVGGPIRGESSSRRKEEKRKKGATEMK
jgi:hypothetical protein